MHTVTMMTPMPNDGTNLRPCACGLSALLVSPCGVAAHITGSESERHQHTAVGNAKESCTRKTLGTIYLADTMYWLWYRTVVRPGTLGAGGPHQCWLLPCLVGVIWLLGGPANA